MFKWLFKKKERIPSGFDNIDWSSDETHRLYEEKIISIIIDAIKNNKNGIRDLWRSQ